MLTRGPLPSSVYWRRRLLALSVALVLVVALAKILGHGGSGGAQTAEQVAHTATTTPSAAATPTVGASASAGATGVGTPAAGTTPGATASGGATTVPPPSSGSSGSVLPVTSPNGMCRASDVVVTPTVSDAAVGQPVTISLRIQTRTEPSCYWRLAPSNLQVKVDSADARVWSTADCHSAITPEQLTLSSATPTQTSVVWNGHMSDGSCTDHTPWANEGAYTVTATSLGGNPQVASFRLGVPTVIVTVTPTPTASSSGAAAKSAPRSSSRPSTAKPTATASKSPPAPPAG